MFSSVKDRIPLRGDAKSFILYSLQNSKSERSHIYYYNGNRCVTSGHFWNALSPYLQQDRDIALAAFAYGHVRVQDLPSEYCNDRDFLLDAVRINSDCWLDLKGEQQRDEDFVRSFESFGSIKLVKAVFGTFPALRHDRDVWATVAESNNLVSFGHVVSTLAPIEILSDQHIMMKFCSLSAFNIRFVHGSLLTDKTFLQQLIDSDPMILYEINREVQILFPDLIVDNLEKWKEKSQTDMDTLLERIHPDLLSSPSFYNKWFSLGGDYVERHFPDSLRDNEQIFLWLAERCDSLYSFTYASDRLKRNRALVWRLIQLQPLTYFHASDDLRNDVDIKSWMLALGNWSIVNYYLSTAYEDGGEGEEGVQQTLTFLQNKVDCANGYMTSILLGISLPSDASHCPLSILNQGNETSLVYKKLIADYAGVPTQSQFRLYRDALRNLRTGIDDYGGVAAEDGSAMDSDEEDEV